MFDARSQSLFALLTASGEGIDVAQLHSAWAEHETSGRPLADIVLSRALLSREALLASVADGLGWRLAKRVGDGRGGRGEISEFSPELLEMLSPELARRYAVLPCRAEEGEGREGLIELLAADPFDSQSVDDLAFVLGKEVRFVVADPDEVLALLDRYYDAPSDGPSSESLASVERSKPRSEFVAEREATAVAARDLESMADQVPIIDFVNLVLKQAIGDKASDIHFEPFEGEFRIRYRIDGALHEMAPPPRQLALLISSRIKVMAGLNIAERRIAQDGRIKFMLEGRAVDLRVSTLPTQFGESIVLRVLDQAAVQLDISQLGLPTGLQASLSEVIRRPNGIFVVTGPTGSGKTTTLYAALRAINAPGMKLLTVEDPVEYEIDGIMQVPLNAPIGLTFASALRAFLRQDPDVIMIGEIRDLETAQVAVQASLTGHLVFSTLHTNDAPGAITRLIDMGVEPFLIGSTLSAVLAQRLVRRVCPHCKTAYQPSDELLAHSGIDREVVAGRPFYRGAGCARCHNTGYDGRCGIFEWLPMSEALRELVLERAPTLQLRHEAARQGMRTLREDGLRAVLDGQTTLDELLRYT